MNSKLIATDDLTIKKLIEFSNNFNDDMVPGKKGRKLHRDISFVTSPQASRKLRVKSAYGADSFYKLRSRKGFSIKHSRQTKLNESSNNTVFKDERADQKLNLSQTREMSPIRKMNNYTSSKNKDITLPVKP